MLKLLQICQSFPRQNSEATEVLPGQIFVLCGTYIYLYIWYAQRHLVHI